MDSACELNAMSKEDELRLRNRELKKEMLDKIVNSMRECFGLTFFGVDVIIEDKTGRYVVIDINNFPAYDGISEFVNLFKDVLIEESETAIYLLKSSDSNKNSLTDQTGDNSLNYSAQIVPTNSIYSRICQWFYTLNKKVA